MESPLCILPLEVICHILYFLSPRDVIRLRAASKQFYDLTYDHAIWSTLYKNARLPRPPGPFHSQSVQFLEHTLVQSERLAHSWTTQPMEDISTVWVRLPTFKIVYGKWLIGCDLSHNFVVRDLDSNGLHSHQLLWESASPLWSWDACSAVSTSGLLIHVVFCTSQLGPWKLLEFRVKGDSLYHTLTLDVPTRRSSPCPVDLDGGHSPFVYIEGQRVIFDVETRSFYEFPEFMSALALSDSHSGGWASGVVLLTKTHIICLFYHADHRPMGLSTHIQAFTVPADSRPVRDGTGVLRLSHEGLMPGFPRKFDLIRNSIVDAVSGATSIRLLHQFFMGNTLHFSCVDLTLHRQSSTDTVLPMTIDRHDIAHVNHDRFVRRAQPSKRYVESSDDGHARGFLVFFASNGAAGELNPNNIIMQFTIDASRDRCVAVLGQFLNPQWRRVDEPRRTTSVLFDGVRGRLYYDRWRVPDEVTPIVNIKY